MNNNIVKNIETEIPKGLEMNDCDYLNSILTLEKNMSNNYSIALNEMSNNDLYEFLFDIYKETQEMQRDLFNLLFELGWYELEKADNSKINTTYNKFKQKEQDII